eukprot:GHUV01051335.1.p2 GENE.GHUV01051335.1~~GHUV01051335.1.p2  ORF type:complete len:124 (-),score=3.71 GHUV01051335.1:529-900(-)
MPLWVLAQEDGCFTVSCQQHLIRRAWAADPPTSYLQNTSDPLEPVLGQTDKWCAPYSYKMRKSLGCGGAHKWTVHPERAFPLDLWPAGSGDCGFRLLVLQTSYGTQRSMCLLLLNTRGDSIVH